MAAVRDVARAVGVRSACDALNVAPATYYRRQAPKHGPHRRRLAPRGLSETEKADVLAVLHEDRFVDQAPAEVFATLLDEGRFVGSIRTMYRVLHENAEVRERRAQHRTRNYAVPELLAERPNQVWSWDITKLKGPEKWNYFHLYVIIDVFSRHVVGWMVAPRESARLAKKLIATTCERQGIKRGQLTIHADRGTSMTSKSVAFLLSDLGVTKTHSRPQVSNDNPYSEATFKTLKYRPEFPSCFGCLQDARAHCERFFDWYNNHHRHSGIALLTPHDVHYGLAAAKVAARTVVLQQAHAAHPERFVRGLPAAASPPTAAWINRPTKPLAAGTGAPHDGAGGPGPGPTGSPRGSGG